MPISAGGPSSGKPWRSEANAGEAMARAAAKLIERTDWLNARAGAETDLAEILLLAGRNAEALLHLEEALQLFKAKGNQVAAAKVRTRLAGVQGTLLER